MLIKTEEGKTKDVGLTDVTAENFICPRGEERYYHCRIEVRKFNAETGERLSKPRIQVFGKKFFETFGLHNLRKQGYTVDILHNPNEWEKENRALLAQIEAEKAEKAKFAAEEAKKAEREALKNELLEELKAQGFTLKKTKEEKETKE